MESAITELMEWIQLHPHWAGLVVLVVSALESFLVVGLFVPGTVVMFAIGAMIAAGKMELLPTLIWAGAGAVIGDGASYLIGRFYHQRLRVMWPFRKYPALISRGVDFFHQHGGKSVLLARFVGPVRPLVPAVAGMLDMPAGRFFTVNILSAIVWAPAYILPGFLFGASLGVAAEIAGRLALLLVILLALLWFSWWLMRRITRTLQPHAKAIQLSILDRSRRHRFLYPLAAALLDPEHPEARGMTVLTGLLLVASLSLLVIPRHLTPDSLLGNIDLYLFEWLQELRNPLGDSLLVGITQLGDGLVLYSFTALMSAWLVWRGRWRVALHWGITVACVGLLTRALKYATSVARPPLLDVSAMSHAFPSAHASVSVAVFGFLAVALARELRNNWHWVPYSIAVFLIVAIGFSRLYLGAHWLSDVLGGWSLGLLWVALMGIAYRQHPAPPLNARLFAPLALVALAVIAGVHGTRQFDRQLAFYQPQPAEQLSLVQSDWLQGDWRNLPAYRDDLKGQHHHPMTLQWMGPPEVLISRLEAAGWRKSAPLDTRAVFTLFKSDVAMEKLPVLPQVHHGQAQKLLMLRDAPGRDRRMALRLWKTGYNVADQQAELWVGNVSFLYLEDSLRLLRFLRTDPDFSSPLAELHNDLQGLGLRSVRRDTGTQALPAVQWQGEVLLMFRD